MKKGMIGTVLVALSAAVANSTPLTQSTFTEVVKDVEIIDQSTHASQPAKVKDLFRAPNLVRTGPGSRAELTAPDQSITRVGANTVFSFSDSGREINLESGCVLFHSPHGKGGGVIKSGGASAAVTGTTLIVSAVHTKDAKQANGFKVILLEGSGEVKLKNGHVRKLKAGELVYLLPGHDDFGPQLTINLARLVAGSPLVNSFQAPLASAPLITSASTVQLNQMRTGRAVDTGRKADSFVQEQQGGGNQGGGTGNGSGDSNNQQQNTQHKVIQDVMGGGIISTSSTGPNIPGMVQVAVYDRDGDLSGYVYQPIGFHLNSNPFSTGTTSGSSGSTITSTGVTITDGGGIPPFVPNSSATSAAKVIR